MINAFPFLYNSIKIAFKVLPVKLISFYIKMQKKKNQKKKKSNNCSVSETKYI